MACAMPPTAMRRDELRSRWAAEENMDMERHVRGLECHADAFSVRFSVWSTMPLPRQTTPHSNANTRLAVPPRPYCSCAAAL
jgi:hypothetical protein